MLYYGFWRDHREETVFYDAFIHSHYISNELWRKDNASYVFFASMFGRLMGDVEQKTGESVFSFIWAIIIESAITMAKRAHTTGKDLDTVAEQMIGKILFTILKMGEYGVRRSHTAAHGLLFRFGNGTANTYSENKKENAA